MKKTPISAVLVLLAAALVSFCIAEISFPETFLTVTDKDWFLKLFPSAWKYNIQIALGALVVAVALALAAYRLSREFALKAFETLFRLGIGGMFIFASIFKIQDPHQFAVLVAQYQFLPGFVNNLFALVYPQFELWFGIAMIVSPFVRESSLAIFLMFVSFIIALTWALALDLGITCGCFNIEGAQDKNETWTALIRDLILLGPTFWLSQRPNRSLVGVWVKKR